MAIAQIQTPQNQPNPLQAILAGQATITNFLDRAFQQSRDQVNNQYRQDAQLVQNMPLAQGLSQRRAQDLDQRLIDRRNFDYRQEQDALQLDLRREQMAAADEERRANREMREREFAFRQNQAGIINERAERTLANQEARLRREEEFFRDVATPTAENTAVPPTVESLPGTTPVITPSVPTNYNMGANTDRFLDSLNTPTQTVRNKDVIFDQPPAATPVVPDRASLEAEKAQLQTGVQAATRLRDANLLRQNQTRLAEVNSQLASIPKPPTPAELRSQEDQQFQRDDRTAKQNETRFRQMVEGDTDSFVPQQLSLGPEPVGENGKPADPKAVADYERRRDLAAAYDKNSFSSELESARNTDVESYVKNIPNPTPTAMKKRREFWQYANGQSIQQTTPQNTPTNQPLSYKDQIDILKKPPVR